MDACFGPVNFAQEVGKFKSGGRLYGIATDTFTGIVQLAKKMETICLMSSKWAGLNAHLWNEQGCRLEGYAVTMRKPAQCPQQPSCCLEGAFMAWPVTPS